MDARVVKKWITLVGRGMQIAGMLLCLVLTGCGWDRTEKAPEQIVSWDELWERRSDTKVVSQEYRDGSGNCIVYYCCRTTYTGERQADGSTDFYEGDTEGEDFSNVNFEGVDRRALEMVIDLDQASDRRDCSVGDWPAVLCVKDGRTDLCWTISPEYSCVIEYDAEAVTEKEIFHMAESVVQQ